MYKLLKIGNKEYKLEYSIEASLYDDCVKSVMNTLLATSGGVDKTPEEMISGMANIPNTALTVFYAGLLQYHGDNPDADGSVPTLATAKKLVTQFIQEHKDDEQGNFYGVFAMCLEQMEEDGFFKLTGLETLMDDLNVAAKPKKTPKKPTDHQKKLQRNNLDRVISGGSSHRNEPERISQKYHT